MKKNKENFLNVYSKNYKVGQNKRCARQRARKGFCYRDIWEIDSWFLQIMPRMLEKFKSNHISFPIWTLEEYYDKNSDDILISKDDFCKHLYYFENKKLYEIADKWCRNRWKEILERMIFLFDESTNDDNDYEYQEKCRKEGLELFVKYFDNLWD